MAAARPSIRYRVSGRLNQLIWHLPVAVRLQRWLSARLYRPPEMEAGRVLAILDALEAAGVPCWVIGGWGLSALAHTQLRSHRDLDLAIPRGTEDKAEAALRKLGYQPGYRLAGGGPLPESIVMRDHHVYGHLVDLHPIDMEDKLQFELADGSIASRPVSCLAASAQLALRELDVPGFPRDRRNRSDLLLLRRLVDPGPKEPNNGG